MMYELISAKLHPTVEPRRFTAHSLANAVFVAKDIIGGAICSATITDSGSAMVTDGQLEMWQINPIDDWPQ